MARGGKREGAGRKPDPNSKRQQALARKAAKAVVGKVDGRGFTEADGTKSKDAPPGWPFGTVPPQAEAPAPAVTAPLKRQTAREFLADLVNDPEADVKVRLDAAKRLIEFEEPKPAPMGKKEAKAEAAKKVAGGRFSAGRAPLALVKH